jgi:hypothetical protein
MTPIVTNGCSVGFWQHDFTPERAMARCNNPRLFNG